jgi:predicted DNA-binding protein
VSNRNYAGGIPFNIRLSKELHDEIEKAAKACGLSKTDIIKLAVEAGLEDLERINFRIGKSIHYLAAAETQPLQAVAEEQAPYGVKPDTAGHTLRAQAAAKASPPTAPKPPRSEGR